VAKADQAAAEAEVAEAQAELEVAQGLAQDEVDNYAKAKEDAIEAAVADALEANEPEPAPEDVPVPDEEPMQAAMAETAATADKAQQAVDEKNQTVADKMKVVEERTEALRRATVVASCSHETARLGREAMALLRSGAQVTDEVYAQLVTTEICLCDSVEKGWVLADFPETANQAKELEKCLIGYDENTHVPVPQDRAAFTLPITPLPEGTIVREDIGMVMQADAKIPSGIKLFIHLDEDKEVLLQRNLGRRHDPVTARQLAQGAEVGAEQGELSSVHEYHLLDASPPEDVVCKDRLVGVEVSDITPDDGRKPTVDMAARVAAHAHAQPELFEFLDRFGTVRAVPCGGAAADEVFEAIDSHVEALDSARREKEAKAKAEVEAEAARIKAEEDAKEGEMKEAEDKVTAAETMLAEVLAQVEEWTQKLESDELPAGTEERAEAEAELTQSEAECTAGEEAIEEAKEAVQAIQEARAAEETAATEAAEAAKPPADAPPAVAKILSQTWATAEWQYTGLGSGHVHEPTQAEKEQAAAAASIQSRFRGNMVRNGVEEEPVPEAEEPVDDGSDAAAASIQARFRGNQTRQGKVIVYMEPSFASGGASSMVDPADPAPASGAEVLLSGSIQDMSARLHRERAMMHEHFRQQTVAFADFIRRPDDKQAELQRFQDSFNSIEQDMRFDDRTKAELHRRVDELALKLWEMVEAREEEALAELQQIRCDGWVPDHVKAITQIYEHSAQLEVDHAETVKKLLSDRAFAAEDKGAGKLPNLLPVEEEVGKKKKDEEAAPPPTPFLTPDVSDIYESDEVKLAREEAEAAAGGKKKGKEKKGGDEGEFEPDPADQYPSLSICLNKALQLAGTSALAAVVGEEAVDDGAKGGKKKKGGEEDEPPKPKSALMLETIELEAKQNEILGQRLERTRLVARTTLDGVRIFGAEVLERMRQAVDARVKSEASCISAVVAVAKQAVEEEVTLPFDLRVTPEEVYRFPVLVELEQDTDLILDKGLRLIPEDPPTPPPVVETLDDIKFSKDQIAMLQDQLLQNAFTMSGLRDPATACMTVSAFVDSMMRFASDDVMLPAKFQELPRHAFLAIALGCDPEDTGAFDAMVFASMVEADAQGVLDQALASLSA